MGDARTVTAAEVIASLRFELFDADETQYTDAELLNYLNLALEVLYEILVYREFDIVRTGTGSFVTVAGTQEYDLSGESMGDLWIAHRVWVSEEENMDKCTEKQIYPALHAEEAGTVASRTEPTEYVMVGDYMWFKEVPDAVYTINVRYFPNFVPLSSTSSNMPYKNFFNQQAIKAASLIAKNRNAGDIVLEAQLQQIFEDRALRLLERRTNSTLRFIPKTK